MSRQPEPELVIRPLEPPASSFKIIGRWLGALFLVNLAVLFWLALRGASPEHAKQVLDGMLTVVSGAFLVLAAFRLLACFPFRLTDLLAMVLAIACGQALALRILDDLGRSGIWEGRVADRGNLPVVIQVCLVAGSFLLAGAALGLLYCAKLGLTGAWRRILAIFCGMLCLPAAAGSLGFAALLLVEWFRRGEPTPAAALYLLGWIFSLVLSAANALLFIRSLSIQAEVPPRQAEGE